MMQKTLDTRRIFWFVGLAFAIAWSFGLWVYLSGGIVGSPELFTGTGITQALAIIALGYMFAPALAHVLTRLITKEGWKDSWLSFRLSSGWRSWLAAWILPVALTALGAILYFAVFPEQYDAGLELITSQMSQLEAQSGQPIGLSPWTLILIQIGQAMLLSPFINGIFTFGEEFGWRAYLQPKLMPLGFRKAMLWLGLIWGLWHAPVIAMGHNYGFDYPGAPWTGILAMIWFTFTVGVILGWLALKGKSVWPAVIGHATLNGMAGIALLFTRPGTSPNPLIGPLPVGLLGGAAFALLAAWLLWKKGGQSTDYVSRETSPAELLGAAPTDALIYTEGLGKNFKEIVAVKDLDLSVPAGEVFGLLGPNGAGKTTTIRLLSALISPSAGGAVVAGHVLGDEDRAIRQDVGILTEAPGMYQQLSAERNLSFFAQLYEVEDVAGQVERFLRMLGLWDRRDDPVGTFSKGMRQKLAIARALLHEPKVLFLDEPTNGLDPEAARIVREFIGELKSEGRTIVLTTHNLDEADRLCDRIAIFKTKLLALDTPTNLRRKLYGRSVVFHLGAVQPAFVDALQKKDYISKVEIFDSKLVATLDDPELRNPELISALVGLGAQIQFVGELRRSLEDVYLQLLDNEENEANHE